MKEILQNNYCHSGLYENAWLRYKDRASFFIKIEMNPDDKLLELKASITSSRSVAVYKDEITLDNMEWTFGYPEVSGFQLDPETTRRNRKTKESLLNHPNNENYKHPAVLTMPTLAMRPSRPYVFNCQKYKNRT